MRVARVTRATVAHREAQLRKAAVGSHSYEVIGEVEAVTRMVVAETGQTPDANEAYTGRRLMPLSLPRLRFLERDYDGEGG